MSRKSLTSSGPKLPGYRRFFIQYSLLVLFSLSQLCAGSYYQEPSWTPRGTLPYKDAINNDFWPPSPKVNQHYNDKSFVDEKLSQLPPPGVHPRVLMTPTDLEIIRSKIALGENASQEFKTLWQREKKKQSAFYALVSKDDKLGQRLADGLILKVKKLEPKLDHLDSLPDTENIWSIFKSIKVSGLKDPPTEIYELLQYDYLEPWFPEAEKQRLQKVVARITKNRISNWHNIPDHFMINNHQGFGMSYLRLMLLIEGQKGFNKELYQASETKIEAKLNYFLNKDGMCYETIKGWLNSNALHATTLRDRKTLKHSHLQAKMKFFAQALRYEDGRWLIRDEMRVSAFHVIWMMRHYRPNDPTMDLLYHASLNTHPELTNIKSRWYNPVGMDTELMLLFAREKDGDMQDWSGSNAAEKLNLPITWKDNDRGYLVARNSWKNDDLKLGFSCKQDFYYGGHEGSEANRFTLWSDGVNWARDVYMLSAKATWLQNMLTVDGKGQSWPPSPGTWLGVNESQYGVSAAGDAKTAYSFSQRMQVHPLDWASAKIPYYSLFTKGNYTLSRDLQVAFHPKTVAYNHGYAHTDYGPWSGETRLVEHYRENNPMKQVYRTVHLAKGKRPYVLVIDDAQKDDKERLYEWNMTLPNDVELLEVQSPEVRFQNSDPSERRDSVFTISRPNTPRDPKTGNLIIKKGDPLCMVKVLWRNSAHGYPIPKFQRFDGQPEKRYQRFSHLSIPAISTSPEFRVLIYPYRHGEPTPKTKWNDDKTQLNIIFGDQVDTYDFAKTDGGRSTFSMKRNEELELQTTERPARPKLVVRGEEFDINDHRDTRKEDQAATYIFDQNIKVQLERVIPPAFLTYTLDGSQPTAHDAKVKKPLLIENSFTLKVKHFSPQWVGPQKDSRTLEVHFQKAEPQAQVLAMPQGYEPGVLSRVYEKATYGWNDKGFFDANKIMLPNLDLEKAHHRFQLDDVRLPHLNPKISLIKQVKGFYRFNAKLKANKRGVYKFQLDSCGPILLTVAGQAAIEERGIFHQHQSIRSGEALLQQGWNDFELIVTDPQFWNLGAIGSMPFELKWAFEDEPYAKISKDTWICSTRGQALQNEISVPNLKPTQTPVWLTQGAIKTSYSREGQEYSPQYLDIDTQKVESQTVVSSFADNPKANLVHRYDGWFHAPETGLYRFSMPRLGKTQIRINNTIVLQQGVFGRSPRNEAQLEAGWYPISLILGVGLSAGSITYPDGSTLPIDSVFQREMGIHVRPDFAQEQESEYEIYQSTDITMELPEGKAATIRYTRDGTQPSATSPSYTGAIKVEQSETIIAAPFEGKRRLATPTRVDVHLRARPKKLQIAEWHAALSKGLPQATDQKASFWAHPMSRWVSDGSLAWLEGNMAPPKNGSAGSVNVTFTSKPKAFSLDHISMKQNALTFALYFRVPEGGKTSGTLISKNGYTALGKGYKTIKLRMFGGRLRVDPGNISSRDKIVDGWNFVALSVSPEEYRIHLNGKVIAKGLGNNRISSDSFDFFTDFPVECRYVSVYNRVLSERDILAIYNSLK